jgi:hypothetical protein
MAAPQFGRGRIGRSHHGKRQKPRARARPSQIYDACKLLRSKGFRLYRNLRNDALVASSSDFMFEFQQISVRKAQQFFAWFQTYQDIKSGLAALPPGLKVHQIRKPKSTGAVRQIESGIAIPASSRPSIAIEGLHSTIPGHYADLDWNDLRKQ